MFAEIFLFELKQGFKKPANYIFFSIFFLLTLFVGLAASGVFDVASQDTNLVGNSAYAIAGLLAGLNSNILLLVNSVILVAVMATAIQKDYEYNTHALFFTKPISKAQYFFGRFCAAFTLGVFVFSGMVTGYFIGSLFGMDTPLMGPYRLMNYLQPFLLFTIPNLFLLGIIIFSLTTFTRSTLVAYLFCIVLLVINIITENITSDLDNSKTAAILEPFGAEALTQLTKYWTPEEQNNKMIPLTGVLLYNRMLWLGLAIVITVISYFRFSFSQFLTPFRLFKRKNAKAEETIPEVVQTLSSIQHPKQDFSTKARWKNLWYLAKFEFMKMVKTPFFIIICALGVVMMFVIAQYMGAIYDTETYPVTYKILDNVSGIFNLFILIYIVFFSGTIIWRERETKMDELVGATPVSNSNLFFSKYVAMTAVVAVLLLSAALTGIIIQLSMGFTDIDLLLYLKSMSRTLLQFTLTIGLCLAIQVFMPNKYVGFFLSLVPLLFMSIVFGLLEWNNQIYHFNSSGPYMPYSDMNGYGHVLGSYVLYKGYWFALVMVLCLLSLLVFARGKEKSFKQRYAFSKQSFTTKHVGVLIVFLIMGLSAGAYIFYNTNIYNTLKSPKEYEKEQAVYEKTYKHYEKTPQPRIVASKVKVDIFPEKRIVKMKGRYVLKNKHAVPVDTIFLDYMGNENKTYSFSQLELEKPHSIVLDDGKFGTRVYKLQQPLMPGDSLQFSFEMKFEPHGFRNASTNTSIVENGTFFNNGIFPSFGYNSDAEIGSNTARKKYGLAPKPRMAPVNDSEARMNTYIARDADWIRFEAEMSTAEDQIAIAPGYLQKEWIANGRRHFIYKMDSPILNFYAFMSADYKVKKDQWKDVNIEIYYQEGHEYNLERMVNSIKKSLDYYTKHFSPYQHEQVRIIEFPRYSSFAQAFPNTIPYSESIGFIAKVEDDPDKIDVPFYITAHEVAHQWWAHQVIGGNVQGAVLMSETMSQYSALMVMEKEYGKKAMKKFLKYEMDKYLQGRTFETKKEVPLMLCENQAYIHYNKGSVIMYALKDYLGEEVLNGALRNYIRKVAFQEPPYTNAIEFVNAIRAVTPDSLQYLIKDMFETITIYENYVKDLSYEKMKDGKYKVMLTVGSAKYRSDSIGKQKKIPVADYMDIGVFAAPDAEAKGIGEELVFQRIKMDAPEKKFEFIISEKPYEAGIDPYLKLIDRKPDNNTWKFGSKPPKVDLNAKETKGVVVSIGGDDEA